MFTREIMNTAPLVLLGKCHEISYMSILIEVSLDLLFLSPSRMPQR